MRRAIAAVALIGAVSAGAAPALGAGAKHNAKDPSHLLVYAQEWSLWPSRSSLPAGSVSVELWNRGEDAHDLRIRRLRGGQMTGPIDGAVKVTQLHARHAHDDHDPLIAQAALSCSRQRRSRRRHCPARR
ncbi:MAG TPA: hypothetical protein VMD48_12585 [Solirubrobacteraceae bacterium]|nr:hypothetical protein [Solirubrobacteraceae bacterium]